MQLFVRTDAGRTLVVAADADTLIRDVLARVYEKEQQLRCSMEQHKRDTAALGSSSNNNSDDDDDDNETAIINTDGDSDPEADCDSDESDDTHDSSLDKHANSTATSALRRAAASRYLHYGGVPLRPQRALCDYGIQPHATLDLSTRLRGGCFSFSILLWVVIFICCLLSICTCGLSLGVAACLLPFALLLPLCCL